MITIPRKKTNRIEKMNSLIQHILGPVLLNYTRNSGAVVTISKVETSRDLRWAKIWITILNAEDQAILGLLKNNIYEIQGELNKTLEIKIVPRISFHLDIGARYADHINQLFKKIEEEHKDHGK